MSSRLTNLPVVVAKLNSTHDELRISRQISNEVGSDPQTFSEDFYPKAILRWLCDKPKPPLA